MDRRTGSVRCCNIWVSRLVSEIFRSMKITHHPNKTSPLGDSLSLAPLPSTNTHQEHVKSTECNTEPPSPCTSLADRCIYSSTGNLKLWSTVLQCQLDLLVLMQLIRAGNFTLYIHTLTKCVHWFFTFDHYHYVRWISVHLREVMTLSHLHPHI